MTTKEEMLKSLKGKVLQKTTAVILAFGFIGLGASCGKKEQRALDTSARATQGSLALCQEHRVPESECTRCDPALIHAFKAKNDWCAEHHLPESQCQLCNPELAEKVTLPPGSKALAGVKEERATVQVMSGGISAPGKIGFNEKKTAYISTRVSGRIEEVFASQFSRVQAGEALFSLYSPDYLVAQSEYLQAAERLAKTKGSSPGPEETVARAIWASAKQKLTVMGLSEKEIQELETSRTIKPHLVVRAPLSGTLVDGKAIRGDHVEPQTRLFEIADLSTVWAIADVGEKDIASIRLGQTAQVNTPVYPDEIFQGNVESAGEVLDEKTRTLKVRVVIANPQRKLKPGMFIQVRIGTGKHSAVAVPESAFLMEGSGKIVFVASGDDSYSRREVKTGQAANGLVEVISGLNADDVVVTQGGFLLKSELLKSKLGAGCAE